jgi:hypothetical protein
MQYRLSKTVALGIAAALTFGFAGSAAAQVTDSVKTTTTTRSKTTVTSSRRIPVRKDESGITSTESAGSLARPNADSIRADSIANAERMRQDSIANVERMRQDSIATAERLRQEELARIERARQDSIAAAQAAQARADSIARAEAERLRQLAKGDVYFRLGAGVSLPQSDFKNGVNNGFNVTGSAGWHKWNSPIGLRLDVGFDRFGVKGGGSSNANIWSGLGEVTLKIPQVLAVSPYLVAGGGVYRLSTSDPSSKSSTKGGWDAGGGITFGVGMAKLFIEGRYNNVSTEFVKTKYVPVILGISF